VRRGGAGGGGHDLRYPALGLPRSAAVHLHRRAAGRPAGTRGRAAGGRVGGCGGRGGAARAWTTAHALHARFTQRLGTKFSTSISEAAMRPNRRCCWTQRPSSCCPALRTSAAPPSSSSPLAIGTPGNCSCGQRTIHCCKPFKLWEIFGPG
jgi:hypothetical protein